MTPDDQRALADALARGQAVYAARRERAARRARLERVQAQLWRAQQEALRRPPRAPEISISDLLEDVVWMLDAGETGRGIAARLGRSAESIERALLRAGRRDLASRVRAAS